MKSINLIVLAMLLSLTSLQAGYNGEVIFSEQEKDTHKSRIKDLINYSADCLENHKQEHLDFYANNCITDRRGNKKCLSKFYGERRYSKSRGARRSDGKKLEYLPTALEKEGFSADMANVMRATSCVGLALQCLKEGFDKTNQSAQWAKIMNFVRNNGVGGTSLQDGLQKIGWKIYYWNPSPLDRIVEDTTRWDKEEKNWASKGYHLYRYYKVRNNSTYWYNTVDYKYEMVGFEKTIPSLLFQYPFWIGTANTGYHVFPGTFEKVVEAHSTRSFTSIDNLELSNFNPMATGGGPRWTNSEKYRSGLIALPPM